MSADFTSSMGMTPFFSPSMGSAKRLKASLISPSSCGETLCSLASLDWRALGAAAAAAPPDLRFGGCRQACQRGFYALVSHAIWDVPSHT